MYKDPPIVRFLPTTNPPERIRAPVEDELESVVVEINIPPLATTDPFRVKVLERVVVPDTFSDPAAVRVLVMTAPPATIRDPVLPLKESAVLLTVRIPPIVALVPTFRADAILTDFPTPTPPVMVRAPVDGLAESVILEMAVEPETLRLPLA